MQQEDDLVFGVSFNISRLSTLNFFPTSGDFCCLLIKPSQTVWTQIRPNVWTQIRPNKTSAWSGSKLFDTLMVFLKDFFEKVNFRKIFYRRQKKYAKLPSMQRANIAAEDYFFFFFSEKISLDTSCKWSAWKMIHMKRQDIFFEKKKMKVSSAAVVVNIFSCTYLSSFGDSISSRVLRTGDRLCIYLVI